VTKCEIRLVSVRELGTYTGEVFGEILHKRKIYCTKIIKMQVKLKILNELCLKSNNPERIK